MVIDFTQPSQLRRFELIVEGKRLFVNQHYMAELSPYFLALCFQPGFKESEENRVELVDVSFDDMLELLQTICPNDDFMIESRITADNFALLTHLSGRLLLTNLRRELQKFVASDSAAESWIDETTSAAQMMEIVVEIIAAGFDDEAVNVVCKQIAKKTESEVFDLLKKIPPEFKSIIEPKIHGFIQYFKLISGCHQMDSPVSHLYKRLFF
uniref:BTB domain-containing protein n=1 Tax=Panagrolaimus sp. JU765 TaxID=591449 RepID=A0AC34R8C9_9BILA